METRRWIINKDSPQKEYIDEATALLNRGELVAFPTETVYGLGACAFNPEAVMQIFEVKGRLPQSPLLVHVSNQAQVETLVTAIPASARLLMENFWPGPLALILPASAQVPGAVLGGKTTVGLRMPAHPVALALIEKAGPIAAPSANLSGRPSPVSAQHVLDDLGGMIAAILDAGPTGSGLESTIIDLSLEKPEILRQGGLPVEELEALLGCGLKAWSSAKPAYETGDMEIILGEDGLWMSLIAQADPGETAIVHYREIPLMGMVDSIKTYTLDLEGQGQGLFTIIREAEAKGYKKLVFAPLPSALSGVGRALAERIRRAAGRQ